MPLSTGYSGYSQEGSEGVVGRVSLLGNSEDEDEEEKRGGGGGRPQRDTAIPRTACRE
ncbi:hypothetical protein SK128_026762, partial [Halocaridina rubra]